MGEINGLQQAVQGLIIITERLRNKLLFHPIWHVLNGCTKRETIFLNQRVLAENGGFVDLER